MHYFSDITSEITSCTYKQCMGCVVDRGFTALECGADGGARTHNLRFRRPLLYPLSYARIALTIAYARPADKPAPGASEQRSIFVQNRP